MPPGSAEPDMSSAANPAQHPPIPATPADISAAIYAAQQDVAARMGAAAWAAQHPAPIVSSATSGDTTMAVWATLHPAPFVLPARRRRSRRRSSRRSGRPPPLRSTPPAPT